MIIVETRFVRATEPERLIAELQQALLTVNTLTPILPICAALQEKYGMTAANGRRVEAYVGKRSPDKY